MFQMQVPIGTPHHTTYGLDTQSQRSHVEHQPILAITAAQDAVLRSRIVSHRPLN